MLPFHLVVLGPQGSGKGTQAELLSQKYQMPNLGAGELIRKKAQEATEVGRQVKGLHDAGALIPFDLTKKLFEGELQKIPQNQTVIFEGYPRTMEQLKDFADILSKREVKERRAIILEIKDETVYSRLSGRRICAACEQIYYPPKSRNLKKCQKCGGQLIKRADDSQEGIQKRLVTFKRETLPVINYFEKAGELIKVDGELSIEGVNQEIVKKLKESG